jgi:hypothetical protein
MIKNGRSFRNLLRGLVKYSPIVGKYFPLKEEKYRKREYPRLY